MTNVAVRFLEQAGARLRFGASLAVTALCGFLSLGTSALPPCPEHDAPAAERRLHFEAGEDVMTLRVTADDHPLVLTLGAGLMLPTDASVTEVEGQDQDVDGGTPANRYWLSCDTTAHEGLVAQYEQEHEQAALNSNDPPPWHDRYHIPSLELGGACELTVVRADATDSLETSVRVSPVFNSCAAPPYYSVVVEVVE